MLRTESQSARYFIALQRAATLHGAVERAADQQREALLKGFEGLCDIPVDVDWIAKQRGIEVLTSEGAGTECGEGLITPHCHGYIVQLRERSTRARRRFALAHEIGHTFFFRDDGSGPRHQIGILSSDEIAAEEYICDLFARTLLIPALPLRSFVSPIPERLPWSVLQLLDRTASRFSVSIPHLLVRLAEVQFDSPSYVVVCFRFKENNRTRLDPALRVICCSVLGKSKRYQIWLNRSALGVNIVSVGRLYDAWRDQLRDGSEQTGGRYVWDQRAGHGFTRATVQSVVGTEEMINVSTQCQGRWHSKTLPMVAANCLYVRRGDTEREAHIITVLAPAD